MRKWVKALLVGAMALGPGGALAAIDNTHHDVIHLGRSAEKCAYCHSKTGLETSAGGATLGKVGSFCVQVCHISGSGLADAGQTEVVPYSPGYFSYAGGAVTVSGASGLVDVFTSGHGMLKTALSTIDDGTVDQGTVDDAGWPYTALNQLQCTSCHAVHDADNPPFLNAKLSDGAGGGFCQKCHTSAMRQQPMTDSGDHPVEFQWNVTAAAGRNTSKSAGDTRTVMNGRELSVYSSLDNVLINVAATGVTNALAATANSLNVNGRSWNMGGHVVNTTTGLPTRPPTSGAGNAGGDQFGCYSCHTVHQALNLNNGQANILTVGGNLIDVCYACHTTEPGITGWGHPIDEEVPRANGYGWTAVPLTAGYSGLNATAPATYRPSSFTAAPYCVSCHDVHNAIDNRMAIRQLGAVTTLGDTASACELCHYDSWNTTTNLNNADEHHPGTGGAVAGGIYTGAGFPASVAWSTLDGLGDLSDGLSCPDCHVGDGTSAKRATAHNWQ